MVFKLAEKGRISAHVSKLSKKFSLVFITATAAGSKVVNHASAVNVFSCKNSQFELHQNELHLNFILQIDRGSIALSLEYHFSNESHVTG